MGAPDRTKVKLIRHAGDGQDMELLAFEGWLETYQQFQEAPVFNQCEEVISFVGEDGRFGPLLGVYEPARSG